MLVGLLPPLEMFGQRRSIRSLCLCWNKTVARVRVGPEISKIHSNLIRAVTCARVAYFVDIGSLAVAIGLIRVETVIRDGYEQHAVTVDVDAA